MKNYLLTAAVVFATILFGACDGKQTHRDVSNSSEQKAIIGQVCEVVENLRAHGVTLKLEREKKTDYISIWNPGFNGVERTFLVILTPGTKLQVLAARECANCPFDRLLQYEVKVMPEPAQFAGKPAYIRAESMALPYVQCPLISAAQPVVQEGLPKSAAAP